MKRTTTKLRWAVCLAVVFWVGLASLAEASGGRLVEATVPGPSLEGNLMGVASERRVQIYLPPSYDRDAERRYPTVYVLHGIFDSDKTWVRPWNEENPGFDTMQALMDAGIASRGLQEMILVIPDSEKSCHYTDSPLRGNWARFIAEDLVGFVDSRYRTIDDAAARGIVGHSMGGHGAIKLAMTRPEVFSVAYGLNPSLLGWGGDLSAENQAFGPLASLTSLEELGEMNFYVQALVSIGHCFAPNAEAALMTDPPFGMVDGKMAALQPGFDAWDSRMPISMVGKHLENLKGLRGLRFDSAFEEQFSHIPVTSREFSRVLTEAGVEHTFEMYNGDHRNRLWGAGGRLYTEVLPYFSGLLEAGHDEIRAP